MDEYDYLQLTDNTNRMAEFTDGRIEVLPPPTAEHQFIVLFLINLLKAFIDPRKLGWAVMSPFRVKIAEGKFRQSDVVFLLRGNSAIRDNRFWTGADLVIEVVSNDNPKRDLVTKRQDYAEAGVGEYWIVDPRTKTITVLQLKKGRYVTHSEAKAKGQVRSALLVGFIADVAEVFVAGRNE